jgi:dipeptide/tripeptide permease
VGGLLGGAVLLYCGLMTTNPPWIVFWFGLAMAAVGATEGPFWATALELGGRRGATAAGIFNTGGNAGGILSPVATPFVSKRLGWEYGIGLGSLVCLAGLLLWLWIRLDENPASRKTAATKV